MGSMHICEASWLINRFVSHISLIHRHAHVSSYGSYPLMITLAVERFHVLFTLRTRGMQIDWRRMGLCRVEERGCRWSELSTLVDVRRQAISTPELLRIPWRTQELYVQLLSQSWPEQWQSLVFYWGWKRRSERTGSVQCPILLWSVWAFRSGRYASRLLHDCFHIFFSCVAFNSEEFRCANIYYPT